MTSNSGLHLTLVRHGQTPCSARGVYCGRGCDPELTPRGQQTARDLAQAATPGSFAALYSSPQRRAQQTLAPLAQAVGQRVHVLPELCELDYGLWDGHDRASLQRLWPEDFAAWWADPAARAPAHGETACMLWQRIQRALQKICRHHAPDAQAAGAAHNTHAAAAGHPPQVLVVSHKAALRIMLCGLLGVPLSDFRARWAWPLGGIAQVHLSPAGAQLQTLGPLAASAAFSTHAG
jgi:probable phosphoglycerate mutase